MSDDPVIRNSILLKHTAAVHASAPLTLVQRKAINALLKNAMREENILEDVYHHIKITDLMGALGYAPDNRSFNDDLKRSLLELSEINIKWNVLRKDRRGKSIGQAAYLASIVIENGVVRYTFSKEIRDSFFKPQIYARLDLEYQKNFRMKHSMPLWELVCEELSTKKLDETSTPWIAYTKIFELLGIEAEFYLKNYALFKNKILNPCIKEINEKSDVIISLEEKRGTYRRLTDLKFVVKKKGAPALWDSVEELFYPEIEVVVEESKEAEFLARLEKVVPKRTARTLRKSYEESAIQNALDFCDRAFHVRGTSIENPVAYFKKALEEGWVLPEVLRSKMQEAPEDQGEQTQQLKSQISDLDASSTIKDIHSDLLGCLGAACYASWFSCTRFAIAEPFFMIESPSQFHAQWLEQHYLSDLMEIISKHAPGLQPSFRCAT